MTNYGRRFDFLKYAIWFAYAAQQMRSADWTATSVNGTASAVNLGGKPALQVVGAGAGTDGLQYQLSDAAIIPQPQQPVVLVGSFWSGAISNHSFAVGMAATDTTIIGSDPTDFIMLRCMTGGTTLQFRARKASGTAEVWSLALPFTLANDTWYEYSIEAIGSSTAGRGSVTVGVRVMGGTWFYTTFQVASQFPDTVAVKPFRAFLAGTTNTDEFAWGYQAGWQEA